MLVFDVFSFIKDVERDLDNGLSLSLAYRSRAGILINLGDGETALRDLKLAASYGLELKGNVDYYIKMAKAYACKCGLVPSCLHLKN